MIYIYGDLGVGQFGFAQLCAAIEQIPVETLSANDVIAGRWKEDASAFIMPGGRDLFYCEKLNGAGVKQIQSYVQEGGSYFGICAGAYFGSSAVHFALDTPLEIEGPRELAFFEGIAKGPIYDVDTFQYDGSYGVDMSQASAPSIRFNGDVFPAYYNGGCGFFGLSHSEVLGWYDGVDIPCIIRCQCGKGQAILSGVHLEFNPADLPDNTPQRVKEALLLSKELQKDAFNLLLQTATCATASS